MSLFARTVVFLCLLTLPSVRSKKHITVSNNLEGGLDLTIHCKSRDDDLGVHVLHTSETFEWSFTPNFWGTTLFYCSFQWQGAPSILWFDIFDGSRDDNCHRCAWTIKKNGPCVTNEIQLSRC